MMAKNSVKNFGLRKQWLQRMVQVGLASGIIAMPWVAGAAEVTATSIVRTDGASGDTTAGNMHTVYAGKSLSSTVGASTFSKFDVKSGDVANMYFRTAAGQENFSTLLNFVDSKINIDGTVNALRNAQIGGHLFFLSPNGMAVGAKGIINAGSLTVMSPTSKWWEDRCNTSSQSDKFFDVSKFTDADLENTGKLAIPVNQSGTICVLGKVNVVDNINLKAGKINIGTDGATENAVTAQALLKTGVTDFSAVVNTSQLPTGVAYQNLTVSDEGGDIVIAAESKTPEDLTSLLLTGLAAGVNVAGGSEVNAKGNLTVTATVESSLKISAYKKDKTEGDKTEKVQYIKINDQEMTLKDFEKKYSGLNAYGVTLGGVAVAGATISVTDSNTTLTGNNVSIKADAKNTYANNAETRSVGADENIGNLIGETLFNALDISFAKMTTMAVVNLGTNSILHAVGTDTQVKDSTTQQVTSITPALQIGANATTKLTLGTCPTDWETAGSVWMPGVGAIYANVNNTALVNVAGIVKSQGSANFTSTGDVKAELKATMGKSTTKDAAGAAGTATLFNLGLVGLEGSNNSTIILADTANLQDYLSGDIVVKALANNSLTSTNEVVASDGTTAVFGVSWFKYNSNATVNGATNVVTSGGNVTLQAESVYTDNEIQLESQSGSTSEKEGQEAAKAMAEAKAKSVKTLLEDFYKKNFSQDSKVGNKVLGWVTTKAEKYDLWKTSGGEDSSFAKTLSEKITAGVTFGYMEETNVAGVNLAAGTTVEAEKDVNIKAYSHYGDTVLNVQGSSTNAYAQTTSGSALVANGAIMLANLENRAEVTAVGAGVKAGGNLTLDAQAAFDYNRINRMVKAMDDLLTVVVKALGGTALTDAEKKELKEGKEAFEQVVNSFKEDLKDDATFQKTLKESKDGYKKLTNKIKSFTENKVVKSFLNSDLVKKLGERLKSVEAAAEGMVGKAVDFLQPANYLNFSVGNTTTSSSNSASQSTLALGITTGITNLDNTGKVTLGKDSVLQVTGGTSAITLQATGASNDVALDGHLGFDSAATGAGGANVVMSVGVHNVNNNSIVLLENNARLSGNTIGINSITDTLHIGFGANKVEAGSSTSTSWTGIVNYVGGESNNILTLDADTELTGNGVTLGTVNITTVADVTGSLATEGEASGSVGIGIILLDRDNICTVKGSITAQTLIVETLTEGNIVNVVADVAFSKAVADEDKSKEEKSQEEAGTAAKDTGEVAGGLLDKEAEKAENGTGEAGSTDAVKVAENDAALPKAANGSGSSGEGAALPSFNLSAAASVAVTDLDAATTTLLDGARITLNGGSKTTATSAKDNSVLVTLAGGAALLKSSANSGGAGDSTASQIAISGAAAVNLAKSNTSAEIKNSIISGAAVTTNEANRNGALVAAGAGVNLTLSGKNSKNVSVGGDCSVNIGNYTTVALLENNTMGGTDLTNRAQDSDLQVAGGIQANIITGGTSSVGVGAAVTWDILHNDVQAIIKDGTYTDMGVVLNEAITGLTQVTAALSLGIADADGAVVEGSVAVGYLDNQTTAELDGITLGSTALTSRAYDEVLTNQHVEALGTDLGIDTEGRNENGEEYTSAVATELAPVSDAAAEEKYVDNTALQIAKQGNKLVTAAVQIAGNSKSSASVGAAVAVSQYNNDFNSLVKNSAITLSDSGTATIGAETKSTMVGVAAGGNGTSKGFAGGGSVVVGSLANTTIVKVENSVLSAANTDIKAVNNGKTVNVAGAVSLGKVAAGLDVVYNSLNTLTGAYLQNSDVSGNSLNLDAENKASIYGVAVGVSAASEGGINGSVAVNVGKNSVIATADSNSPSNVITLSDLIIHSGDDSALVAAAGGLSVGSKVALGGALAWNELQATDSSQYNLAGLSGYAVNLDEDGKVKIEATDTAQLTTVGLGVGLAGKSVAVQGADATAKVTKQTSAWLEDVTLNNSNTLRGTVSVKANTDNTMTTVGAVVVGSLNFTALGAGTTQNYLTADTLARVRGGSINLAGLDINAVSTETVKNVAVGVAASRNLALGGSVVVNTVDNDTSAVLGDEEDKLAVNSAGAVSIAADSREDLFNLCGQLSATLGSGASISGGFAVAVDTIKGNTEALAENVDVVAKGLTVWATGKHILQTIPFVGTVGISTDGLGIGGGAVVGITNISGNTLADLMHTDYNKSSNSINGADLGDVAVKAEDVVESETIITSVETGISSEVAAALGAGVDVNKNTRKVEAQLADGTLNANKVNVTADSDVTLKVTNTAVNAGVSGTVAADITGNISYIQLQETTNALVNNITSRNNGLTITADHKEAITLYATSATVSVAEDLAAGVQVGINVVKNAAATKGELAASRINHYEDQTAVDQVAAKNDVSVHVQEKGLTVSIALGSVGAGVLVGNNTLEQVALARVYQTTIGTESVQADNVAVTSDNILVTDFDRAEVSAGTVALGVGVNLNKVDSTSEVELDQVNIYAHTINVTAKDNKTINGKMTNVALGGVPIGVSSLHNYLGAAVVDETYDGEDVAGFKEYISTDSNETEEQKKQNQQQRNDEFAQYAENDFDATRVEKDTVQALDKINNEVFEGEYGLMQQTKQKEVSASKFTDSDKEDTYDARKLGNVVNVGQTNLFGYGDIVISSESIINTDTQLLGGGAGVLGVQVEVNKQRVQEKVGVILKGSTVTSETGNITVKATGSGTLKNTATSVSAAAGDLTFTLLETIKEGDAVAVTVGSEDRDDQVSLTAAKDVTVSAQDSLGIENKLNLVAVGGAVIAVNLNRATDSTNNRVSLAGANTFSGGNSVVITACSVPQVQSEVGTVVAEAVAGAGLVSTTRTDGQLALKVGDGNSFSGPSINLLADISKPEGEDAYNLKSNISSVGVSAVGISVSKARTYGEKQLSVTVGDIEVGSDNGGASTSLQIGSLDELSLYNYIGTTSVGALASDSVFVQSKLNDSITVALDTGDGTLKNVTNLLVYALNYGSVQDEATSTSVALLALDPYAARIENEVLSSNNLTLKGNYQAGNIYVGSMLSPEMELQVDTMGVSLAGYACAGGENVVNLSNTIALSGASLEAEKVITIESNVSPSLNKAVTTTDDNAVVHGNGIGALNFYSSQFSNQVDIDNNVCIDKSSLLSDGTIDILAIVGGTMRSVINSYKSFSFGVGGDCAYLANNINSANLITLQGDSRLETSDYEQDITLAACDNLEVTASSYSEVGVSISLLDVTNAKTVNNITRSNQLNLQSGRIFSRDNVNLYAQKDTDGNMGVLTLTARAETYNGGFVPIATPTLANNLVQNNQIVVGENMAIYSICDVNLYADTGLESVSLVEARHSLYRNKTNVDYVVTAKGGLDACVATYNDFVQVDGSITAGVGSKQSITFGSAEQRVIVVSTAEEKAALIKGDNDLVYTIEEFTGLTEDGLGITIGADSILGLTKDQIRVEAVDYKNALTERYHELQQLITDREANGDKDKIYVAYQSELNRIIAQLDKMQMYSDSETYFVVAATLPNLVGSGGNVNVTSRTLYGQGNLTAKGEAEISVQNYTNLLLYVNGATIYAKGGELLFNSQSIGGTEQEKQQQIRAINKDTLGAVKLQVEVASASQDPVIDIRGHYDGQQLSYKNEEGETSFTQVSANLEINGDIANENGTILLQSANNDVIVEGITAEDSVSVKGKKVDIIAGKGAVYVGFSEGITSVGDMESQYADYFAELAQSLTNGNDGETLFKTFGEAQASGKVNMNTGVRVGGTEVYICAEDININGVIQSGYGKYYASLQEEDGDLAAKIEKIKNSNAGSTLTDAQVKGREEYKVYGGTYVLNEDGYYDYQVAVYYNPSTNTLLTEDVDETGGKISLTGRIISTGSSYNGSGTGAIYCLDGAYNIDIVNELDSNLKLGDLIVNDVSGVVKITDIDTGDVTEITRSGITSTGLNEQATEGAGGDEYDYIYSPLSGLRYNWSVGSKNVGYQTYSKTMMAKWWGAAEAKEISSATCTEWVGDPETIKEGDYVPAGQVNRPTGVTAGELDLFAENQDIGIVHNVTEENQGNATLLETRRWSTGLFGCHKWTKYTWRQEIGKYTSDTISIKADNQIGIKFIGTEAEQASVNISSSAADKTVILSGNIGNTKTYSATDSSVITEKGSVHINASCGSISQTDDAIYGSDVTLSAKNDIENINVVNGSAMNLSAVLTGEGSISITAQEQEQVVQGSSVLNVVQLTGTDSAQISKITLTGDGSLVQAAGQVSKADRIDLTANYGAVLGADNGNFCVNVGQQPINIDSLSASLNISARGDIKVEQTAEHLRVGRIYSAAGNVVITVTDGSLVDALPYNNITTEEEKDLQEQWQRLGLIAGGDSTLVAKKQKAEENAAAAEGHQVNDYEVWSEEALLYNLEDSIINPQAGVKPSAKDPNIYANNITINAKSSVGLNSEETYAINLNGMTLEELKILSKADAGSVVMSKDGEGNQIATVNKKLALGLQHSSVQGQIVINSGEGNVYLETRRDTRDELSNQNLDLQIGNINAAAGNVLLSSLGSINGSDEHTLITGKDVVVSAGATSTNEGNIGSATQYLQLAMSGNLTALATGNIYLAQAEVGGETKDWYIASINAGEVNGEYSSSSGNIYLISQGNVYGYYNSGSTLQGYISTNNQGNISINAGGNIGYYADGGLVDTTKTLRLKNAGAESAAASWGNTVSLVAGGGIAVEGVSTDSVDEQGYQAAGGYLNMVSLSSGSQTVALTVHGALNMNGDYLTYAPDEGEITLRVTDLVIDKNYSARKLTLQGGRSLQQEAGTALTAQNLTLVQDEFALTYGSKMLLYVPLLMTAGSASGIRQEEGGIINADSFQVNSVAGVVLEGVNQFRSMKISATEDITVVGRGLEGLGTKLNLPIGDDEDINVEITNDWDQDQTVNGDVSVEIMASGSGIRNELDISGTVQAQGNIYLTNAQGNLYNHNTIHSQEGQIVLATPHVLFNEGEIIADNGDVLLFGDGSAQVGEYTYAISVVNLGNGNINVTGGELAMYGTKSVLNVGDCRVMKNASGEGGDFALYSAEGSVLNLNAGGGSSNIFQVEGNLILSAPQGTLVNQKGFAANDDVWLVYGGSVVSVNDEISSKYGNVIVQATEGQVILAQNTKITAGDSVVIGGKQGAYIYGDIIAENGLAAVGTEIGNIEVDGTVCGATVSIYTESADSLLDFDSQKITATKELILAGNNWGNQVDFADFVQVRTDADGYDLKLFGAGRTLTGDFTFNLTGKDPSYRLKDINVGTLVINSDSPVEIEHLAVADRAELNVMGTKTSVYGRMQAYDADSKVIYYASGGSRAAIDLHELYFGEAEKKPFLIGQMKEDSSSFITNGEDSGSKGMFISIQSPGVQRGDGILLKNYYGQITYRQRYSAEQWMQYVLQLSSMKTYNNYFQVRGMDFYQSWNLWDLPEVAVNCREIGDKVQKWEF